MNKITTSRTEARKIENRLNKIGFVFGFDKYLGIVTIDKPILKKCFDFSSFLNEKDLLEAIEKWLKSDENQFKFYFNKKIN